VMIGEVRVAAGDLVVADDTGVCFIPRDNIMQVLEACEKKQKGEDERVDAIARGVPVPVFYNKG
jgi:4-hydroxy-4-methyl-2-oxoglutarate aldolase